MKKYITILGLVLVIGLSFCFLTQEAMGSISLRVGSSGQNEMQAFNFLTATTTSATSTDLVVGRPAEGYFKIVDAKKVTFYFSRADSGGNVGSSTFRVQVTPDGTNWYPWNKLVQNIATTSDELMLDNVMIEAATSTTMVGMDLDYHSFYAVRCTVAEATDGAHTCSATAEF